VPVLNFLLSEDSGIGPRIGPSIPGPGQASTSLPSALPPSLPAPPGPEVLAAQHSQYAGATISAAPQPQGLPPVMNPFGYGGAAPPGPPPISAPYMRQGGPLPSQQEALRSSAPPMTRPAEDELEGEPSAKRQRIPKLGNGQLYSEQEWLDSHPVRRGPR
jgi:splicing factor 3A subunit 1